MKEQYGFSLVELIISLGLMSILMLLIFNILLFNLNMYNKTEASIEIQEQGQFLKQFIEDKLYISRGIDSIVDINGNKIKTEDFKKGEIKELRFKLEEVVADVYIDKKSKKVFFKKDLRYNGYEIGDYVNKINLESIDNGRGVKIDLEMEKNNKNINVEFYVYFRNYNG